MPETIFGKYRITVEKLAEGIVNEYHSRALLYCTDAFNLRHPASVRIPSVKKSLPWITWDMLLRSEQVTLVDELLRLGADINTRDYRRNTLLHLVREEEIFQILIRNGAGVNLYNIDGMTPLFTCKRIEFAKQLIDAGADVNYQIPGDGCSCAENQVGCSPLHLCNSVDMARLLIRHGANIDAVAAEGTPLHYHCAKGHLEIIRLLVRRGADLNAVNNRGMTPFMYIRDNTVRDNLILKLNLIETEHGLERRVREKKQPDPLPTKPNKTEDNLSTKGSKTTTESSKPNHQNDSSGTENRERRPSTPKNITGQRHSDNRQNDVEQPEHSNILSSIFDSLAELLPNPLRNAIRNSRQRNRTQRNSAPQNTTNRNTTNRNTNRRNQPNQNTNSNNNNNNNNNTTNDYRFDLDYDDKIKKTRRVKGSQPQPDHRFDLDFDDKPAKRRKKRNSTDDDGTSGNRYDLDFDDD